MKSKSSKNLELKQINRALESLLVEDKKEKKRLQKQHVQSLKTNLKNQKVKEAESIKQNQCPKCGGELTLKKGKYGRFMGVVIIQIVGLRRKYLKRKTKGTINEIKKWGIN
ncbi:hypothetical protein UACE39S_00736 [Ureibacillus acetophenoni]